MKANHSNNGLYILRLLFANFYMSLQVRGIFVVFLTKYAYMLFLRFLLVCFQMRGKLSFRTVSKENFSTVNTIIVEIKMSIQVMFQGCFEATFRTLEVFSSIFLFFSRSCSSEIVSQFLLLDEFGGESIVFDRDCQLDFNFKTNCLESRCVALFAVTSE